MLDALVHLDQTLTLAINGSHSLWLDGFALAVTATITWMPAALVLFYVIIRHGEMRDQVRKSAVERFSIPVVAEQYVDLYKEVAGKNK